MGPVRRNIILNGIANILQKTVNVANQLLLVPFFLSAWGAEYYGEWLTLCTIPSVLMFSDMGFGTSACNAFVLTYSGGEHQKAANIFKTGFYITTCCIILGIVMSFGTMVFAMATGLLDNSLISADDAVWALTFMMAGRLVGFYNQLFEAFFRSKHHAASATNYRTIEGLILIAVGITVLMTGHGIVAYALCTFIGSLVFNIGYALLAIHIIGDLPLGKFDRSEVKMICGKGLGYMASPLWQAIYFQGTTLVVRTILGAEAVAIFNTVRKVCRCVNQVFNIISSSIFPELQIAIGKNNMLLAKSILLKSMKITSVLGVSGFVLLSLVGQELYNWWTNGMFNIPLSIWIVFMFGILLNAIWWTAGCTFRAFNEPFRYAIYGLTSSCVAVFFTYIASCLWGMLGAVIGYSFFDVMMLVLVIPYVYSKFNKSKTIDTSLKS